MRLDKQRNYVAMTKDEIYKLVEENRVRYIALWFTDITGAVKSVVVPAKQLASVLENGVHFDGSSIEGVARVAESDMMLIPDLDTFTLLPWNNNDEERTARLIVACILPKANPSLATRVMP